MFQKPSIVLGISFGHGDSSAALIVNGVLVAAAEEERFVRVKHYGLFPTQAIAYCLAHAKLTPQQVDTVAIGRKPTNFLAEKLKLIVRHPALLRAKKVRNGGRAISLRNGMQAAGLTAARVIRVEHHVSHMMSARHLGNSSPLAFLTFDGLGDFVSTAIGTSKENSVEVLDRVLFPHSLGFFYTAMTQYLGFPHFGDEFKVMGLSSYGQPRYLEPLRDLVREKNGFGFELNLEAFPILRKPLEFFLEDSQPKLLPFYHANYLTHVLGLAPRKSADPLTAQHHDLAKSVQARFEEIANRLLMNLYDRVHCKSLALAGGCAHNSVWVGKIPANTPFRKIFVAPASHDAGLAVGAAIEAYGRPVEAEGGNWALLGPSHEESTTAAVPTELEQRDFGSDERLIQHLVDELADGKIIGLFHGRMEFGPRALGSRSILCDPRGGHMKDKLNARVKHREKFRPFAASVLFDHQDDWFQNSFYSPTMEAVFDVKDAARKKIPAVVHTDNTCRIQSVTKDQQPFYYALIEAFRKKTGIPMLLNTSFNDCEPIVCNELDALNCFLNCEMDCLVIGRKLFVRKASAMALTA